MGEIDPTEARFFLSTEEERAFQVERGYVRGMNVKAPAVVSLNAALAAMAVNELAVLVSGVRPVSYYTEFDLLGVGRPVGSQWCQRPPHIEPPGSGKLSHPGSPIVSQPGSAILSHPGSAIWSHPVERDRIPSSFSPSPEILAGAHQLQEVTSGGTEESGDRHP
jgi:hypothetical protein